MNSFAKWFVALLVLAVLPRVAVAQSITAPSIDVSSMTYMVSSGFSFVKFCEESAKRGVVLHGGQELNGYAEFDGQTVAVYLYSSASPQLESTHGGGGPHFIPAHVPLQGDLSSYWPTVQAAIKAAGG